jgi:hypothetical protein
VWRAAQRASAMGPMAAPEAKAIKTTVFLLAPLRQSLTGEIMTSDPLWSRGKGPGGWAECLMRNLLWGNFAKPCRDFSSRERSLGDRPLMS